MQFTPQQMAGGMRYNSSIRIGNWYEDLAQKEAKQKEFHQRAERGDLSIQRQRSKIDICLGSVPHSYSEDGLLRFGDYIMLMHDQTGSVLACDVFENVDGGLSEKFMLSNSYNTNPVARNVFKIMRAPSKYRSAEDTYDDDVLRIGCAFCLGCNEGLLVSPKSDVLGPMLYVSSIKKNERSAAVNSNRQMTYLSSVLNSDAIWTVTIPSLGRSNASERFLSVGSAVYSGESIQLSHRQTSMLLSCSHAFTELTEFGNELESYADRSCGCGKLSLIESEFKGLSTSHTLAKPDSPAFAWHFVTASSPDAAQDRRRLPPAATVENLTATIRNMLIAKEGLNCFEKLRSKFRRIATDYNGKIELEDLKTALMQAGVSMHSDYLTMAIEAVGVREGLADFEAVVRAIETAEVKE